MPAGKVAPNKTRTNITIEKELKSQPLVINILKEYMKNQ